MINYATYNHEDYPDVLVISVTGRLDTGAAGFLLDCIQGFIERGERKILIDFDELELITSLGLATLVRANSRLKTDGGEIAIANASGIVAETLRIVHFDRLFHLFDSVEEAAKDLVD